MMLRLRFIARRICYLIWHWHIGINVFNKPSERFAIQTLPQLDLLANVAKVSLFIAHRSIVIFLVVIEPDLSEAVSVPPITAATFRKLKIKSMRKFHYLLTHFHRFTE